ncbi:ScyD/ScyE family protein [Nakamurella deserti]|uniref:ScyD/ScyE family protein n=1 Tax=Nakamurella deserti TaxID=2164074 RepID=UPI000DBE03B6|nr:ScyD/ScyE family protein [Nakamurella deserti]
MRNRWIVGSAAGLLAAALVSPVAQAGDGRGGHGGGGHGGHGGGDPSGITVVASGLDGPRQISDKGRGHTIFVAEADAGRVSRVDVRSGEVTPLLTDLGAGLVQGVDKVHGQILVAVGEPGPGSEAPETPFGISVLLGSSGGGTPEVLEDLGQFERDNNPDGQPQFGPEGLPLEALSNPYFVRAHRDGSALIADAGGNDILFRTAAGDLQLWRTLPLITEGPCAEIPNNDPAVLGCDPVPTGIAYGNHDDVYVSALGGLVPGAGRVFVYDWNHQEPVRVLDGFTGPAGVEVDAEGNVYVSELTEGAPADPSAPPPGFDPATVGQIVKVAPDGTRTYAQVPLPAGLLIHKGELYASAWALGAELGLPDAGQIVRVDDRAFQPAAEPAT